MRPAGGGISGTVVDAQTYAVLMFISGVMLTRSSGKDGVRTAEELDRILSGIVAGVALQYDSPT